MSSPAGRRLRGAGLAALLCLVATACQLPAAPVGGGSASSSAAPPGSSDLRSADSRLFNGDYAGAEKSYQDLVRAGAVGAASHYALLLTYESRFSEALVQARAGVRAQSDSSSLARLTRALDWSFDVPAAVRTGAQAVAAKPVDPLAHIFYAEALADSGRFRDAETELRSAESQAGSDAYVSSELDREWANYWRDRQDNQQELNYVQLAVKAQPKFPERRLELARYQYVQKKQEVAEGVLAQLKKEMPGNYWVMTGAGDAAFLGQDFPQAVDLYHTAAETQPGGSEANLGLAEIAVAQQRDFRGAHDLLLKALQANPNSEPLYLYLHYLDLLVLKIDPEQDLKGIGKPAVSHLAASRQAALDRLNQVRAELGLPAIKSDPGLEEAAEAHSYYFLFNYGQPQLQGLGIHSEDPALPGFVGANGLLRARHFGYPGVRGSEVINHVYTPEAAIQIWLDSVFHRYPMLSPETRAGGYGEAQLGILSVSVYDFGLTDPGRSDAVVYPAAGQHDVPAAFTGNEVPDPVPPGGSYPVGYPLTLQVGSADVLEVATSKLQGPDGQDVPSYVLLPNQGVGPGEWALLAKQPLQPGKTYSVEVSGKLNGDSWTKKWQFTVTSPIAGALVSA